MDFKLGHYLSERLGSNAELQESTENCSTKRPSKKVPRRGGRGKGAGTPGVPDGLHAGTTGFNLKVRCPAEENHKGNRVKLDP